MSSVAKLFTLGKNERLKSRKQIELLFSSGKKITVTPFRIFFLISSQQETGSLKSNLNFGVGVSAKNFKKAVDRNRIKRLLREAWRLQKNELKGKLQASGRHMNVFFIYTAKELPDYGLVFNKTELAIKKLIKEIE